MQIKEIYQLESPYRDPMVVKGYTFGKGDKAACILGSMRGNEIQQLYICSQLVKALKELENNGCISANKEIIVIPCVNTHSLNVGKRFWTVDNTDINKMFPGNEEGATTSRIASGVLSAIKDYSYGIQLASFYMSGEFVPHIRMMETGYQNTSLANLFGLPFVVVREPRPIDTKGLNYNWQNELTAAFSLYTNKCDEIDEKSAKQAVAAVLRFLTRMGVVRYESHSGYISHVIYEKELKNVHSPEAGIYKPIARVGEDVRYKDLMGVVIDPFEGHVKAEILAPTDGIVFFAKTSPTVTEGEIVYRLIHRLHE